MGKLIDLTGQRFGRLVVLNRASGPVKKGCHVKWRCQCDCGKEIVTSSSNLRMGASTSCGCWRIERLTEHFNSQNPCFGAYKTRLYSIYINMLSRTGNPRVPSYKNYGGRGIQVCQAWKDNYKAFFDWAVANGYDDTLTLDRIDVNGGYFPNNCRWVTPKVQANNTRVNHILKFKGNSMTLAEWGDATGIPRSVLYKRLKRGWSVEKVLTEPLRKKNSASAR